MQCGGAFHWHELRWLERDSRSEASFSIFVRILAHIFLYYSLAEKGLTGRVELCVGGHDYVVRDLVKGNAFIGRT